MASRKGRPWNQMAEALMQDVATLCAARRGELALSHDAQEAIAMRIVQRLEGLSRVACRDLAPEDRADVVQNILVRLLERAAIADAAGPNVAAYLFTILRNAQRDLLRQRLHHRTVSIDHEPVTLPVILPPQGSLELFKYGLTAHECDLITAKYELGLTFWEIAHKFNLKFHVAVKRVQRAVEKLRARANASSH